MRVISVDPGYDRLGVAIVELVDQKEKLFFSTCIQTDKKAPIHERLKKLGDEFTEILKNYSPDTLGIETLFFNKNQKTAMAVSEARGILIYLAQVHNCVVHEFSPQAIKVAVTGYGGSDKNAVIDMVQRLIPEAPKDALDDEYDAIAVGITCLAHFGRSQ